MVRTRKSTFLKRENPPNSFLGQNHPYATSRIVVLPIAYEGTVSYGRGTQYAPRSIIHASRYLEWYDEETNKELCQEIPIHTVATITGRKSSHPKAVVRTVSQKVHKVLRDGKFMCALGGEHTISLGIIPAYCEKYTRLSVLHIDAHADLRKQYEGTTYSHACVMRPIIDCAHTVHVGIRSLSRQERDVIKKRTLTVFFMNDMQGGTQWISDVVKALHRKVYVTIDVDAFDPSIIPSTGTPEPGGLTWHTVLKLLKKVAAQRTVVGFDLVELSPRKHNNAPSYTCAKLCYKFLNYIFM